MARTWSISDSFPNFCPCFQLRTSQKKTHTPEQSHRTPHFSSACPQLPGASSLPQGTPEPSLWPTAVRLSHSSACLSVSGETQALNKWPFAWPICLVSFEFWIWVYGRWLDWANGVQVEEPKFSAKFSTLLFGTNYSQITFSRCDQRDI